MISGPAAAEETEIELVQRFVRTEAVVATVDAGRARVRGVGAGPAVLPNPELLARYENAPGAVTVTRVVGAGLDLDLGFGSLSERAAARQAGMEAEAHRGLELLDRVCGFRGELLEAWAAQRRALVVTTAQERVDRLTTTLAGLAEAGEVAAYDRDRAALAAFTHRVEHDSARGNAAAALAQLTAKVGPVDGIALLPLAPLPERSGLEAIAAVHPRVVAARANQRAATARWAAARRWVLPQLRVSAGLRSDTTTGSLPQRGFEVGGAWSVPLWDWSRAERLMARAQVSSADAAVATTTHDVVGAMAVAHARAASFEDSSGPEVDAGSVWTAASALYLGGEERIGTLLAAASDVEAAEIAAIERERRQRHARLELDCATGRLQPARLQAVLEETLR